MRIKKETVYEVLTLIQYLLKSDKYKAINEANKVAQYHLEQRFLLANNRLSDYDLSSIPLETSHGPLDLRSHWIQFDAKYNGDVTPELKREYGVLIKETLEYLAYIISLPKVKVTVQHKTSQTIDLDSEKSKMRKIMSSRQSLMAEIERQTKKKPQDEDLIQKLKNELEKLNASYIEIQGTMSKAESDASVEQNISNKIKESFNELKDYAKVLEDEKNKIKWEYRISLGLIPVLIFIFVVLYIDFLNVYNTCPKRFDSWLSFLPYTVMIPIFVGLMWLSVYLKDRASKISIELSTRLFNIHYLEGLMKLTNSVSLSHEESLKKLDKATESLMQSYLSQVKHNHMTEKDVSKIEIHELEANPYWKLLQKLESVIKLIKQ